MKLKKLLSNIVASAMMLTTMAVSTVTASAANYIDIELNVSQDFLGAAIICTNGDYSVAGETVTNESYWAQINRQDGGEDTKYAAAFGSSLVEGSKQSFTISADSTIGEVKFITVGWSNEYKKNVGHEFTVDLGSAVDNKLQVQLVPDGDVAEEQTSNWYYVQDVAVKYLAKVEAPDLTGYNAYDFAPASGSAEAWAQPASVEIGGDNKITTKVLGGDFIIAVPYESNSKPELAFSDGSGDGELNWVKVNSCTVADGVAYFKKADCTAVWTAAGGSEDFSELVKINVCAQADPITVKDVKLYSTVAAEKVPVLDSPEFTLTAQDSAIKIDWKAVEGAEAYVIYCYDGKDFWQQGETAETTYTLKDLINGTEYGIVVLSRAGKTLSEGLTPENVKYATPVAPVAELKTPEITLTAQDGAIKIDWKAVEGAEYYIIHIFDGTYFWQQGATEETTYTLKGLVNGTEYGLAVQTYGNGVWSNVTAADVKKATPVASVKELKTPEITLTPENGAIKIDWSAVEGAWEYIILCYDGTGFWYQGQTTGTTYTLENLWNGTQYGIVVQSYANFVWSDVAVEDVKYAAPVAPELKSPEFTLTAQEGAIKIDWNAEKDAQAYIIYCYDGTGLWYQGQTNETTFTLEGLWNGREYGLAVQSYGSGVWSSVTVDNVKYATTK